MPTPNIPDISGLHPFIDQQAVKDMWGNFHDPDSGWSTTINLDYEQNPLHHARVRFKWSEAQVNEVWKALGWGTPYPNPNQPPALKVIGGKLTYGNITKFCGVSRREILQRAKGQFGGLSPEYTLADYEKDIIESGINHVRHIGVMDSSFLYEHCKRMKDAGIVVEVEVYESETNEIRVDLNAMGELAKLGNVSFDVGNEFLDRDAVDDVIHICNELIMNGCIVSAGAWGYSHNGGDHSKEFHSKYNGNHINTYHRHWTASSIQGTVALGKPVAFNEFFSQGNLTLQEVKDLFDLALNTGCQLVNYYGQRCSLIPGLTILDPWHPPGGFNKAMLIYAGQKAKELNPA